MAESWMDIQKCDPSSITGNRGITYHHNEVTVTTHIPEEYVHILVVAIAVGKQRAKQEIREALGIK